MILWIQWWRMVRQLRPAFARETTFLWFALGLVGLTVRPDLRGVTSIIRALGLKEVFYDRLLDFFHSNAVHVDPLAALWCRLILTILPAALVPKVKNRMVFIGDGIKLAKTGRKMPAVMFWGRSCRMCLTIPIHVLHVRPGSEICLVRHRSWRVLPGKGEAKNRLTRAQGPRGVNGSVSAGGRASEPPGSLTRKRPVSGPRAPARCRNGHNQG